MPISLYQPLKLKSFYKTLLKKKKKKERLIRAGSNVFTLDLIQDTPFYRYDGHIELIRFKKYYRMSRRHEHISFVLSSAFRDIFLKVFLE